MPNDERRSSLRNRLRSVQDVYLAELEIVKRFILTMEKAIKSKPLPFETSQLSREDFNEALKIVKSMSRMIRKPIREGKPFRIKSRKAGELLFYYAVKVKHEAILSEMALVHLIALEEAFLKDYLQAVLTYRRELLRSNATLTFEELCEMSSIESIIELMAEQEVEKLSRGDIDHAAKYIRDRYHFSLEDNFEHWKLLRESYYRRNVIVHNRGYTNKIYCLKTGHRKLNDRLLTNTSYLLKVCDAIIALVQFVHSEFSAKIVRHSRGVS